MESTNNDVFRFMAVRPVQRVSELTIRDRQISLQQLPNGKKLNISSMESISVDKEPVLTLGSIDELSSSVKLPQIDQYLLSKGDRPTLKDLIQEIKDLSKKSPKELIETKDYNNDRSQVAATLMLLLVDPAGREDFRDLMLRYMQVFGLIEYIALYTGTALTADDIFNFLLDGFVVLPQIFNAPANALARTPGVADLKVVRQKLVGYEAGEIAYIENVLKGEKREREHRREDVREETFLRETENTAETSSDLQSTERFELQKETSSVISEDSQLTAGASISASYGPVSASANLGYATSNSKQESENTSSNYARDITQRSSSRIQERVREVRTTRTLRRIEEINKHTIDNNKQGSTNIAGIYRWVDKIYEAQVFNYGKRLLLEFVVPEPAAFYKYAFDSKTPQGITVQNPEEPMISVRIDNEIVKKRLSPSDITRTNYLNYVAQYLVRDVDAPPDESKVVDFAWEERATSATGETGFNQGTPGRKLHRAKREIDIPSEYSVNNIKGKMYVTDFPPIYLAISGSPMTVTGAAPNFSFDSGNSVTGQIDKLSVALFLENAWGFSCSFAVKVILTKEAFEKWQLKTYEAIMTAYFELKSQYDEQVAASKIQQGAQIRGRNPLQNRAIERTEIKKSIVSMLTQQNFDGNPLEGKAIVPDSETDPSPRIKFEVAEKERDFIQWFEQAFEWEQMTYVYYPYFWGDKSNWSQALEGDDADPLFSAFLQAGAARVIVPVRLGFGKAMSLYLATGIIWRGTQLPQVNAPLYVSIVQELQEQQQADAKGVAEGKPWEVRLPTTLTILQESSELPKL
jgi:hypothetical protein